ncbi:MAG: VTT domain-containing protein [Aquificaceae bacterium]|nr:VTT domain-containing protein [Aquificaceae bacterium]MDW8237305.1 VTT domain-containing protein [Aquificaceae bacterium]
MQPVPPYPFVAGAKLFGMDPLIAGIVAFVGNILGAICSYSLARVFGERLVIRLFSKKLYQRGHSLFEKYGILAVLIGEPYKLVCYLAGAFAMPFWSFLLASFIARSLRIGVFVFFGNLVGAGGLEPPTGRL